MVVPWKSRDIRKTFDAAEQIWLAAMEGDWLAITCQTRFQEFPDQTSLEYIPYAASTSSNELFLT